ncbi:hypothetical protein WMY93_015822 [Mugilogobius chulae]|uniref:cGMP-dependent protein kinase interacting domain-containing protein n=1 Tax=Mugilogobius chulae TaxID=88201 RepID=A0AAW0NYC1_9GOBI
MLVLQTQKTTDAGKTLGAFHWWVATSSPGVRANVAADKASFTRGPRTLSGRNIGRPFKKESTLKTAEQKLLQEDLPQSQKRKRIPRKLFIDTEEETGDKVSKKKKNYKLIAARTSELEVLAQNQPAFSQVDTASVEEELRALRNENKELRDQLNAGLSPAREDLETQIRALTKENARLRNMAIKGSTLRSSTNHTAALPSPHNL